MQSTKGETLWAWSKSKTRILASAESSLQSRRASTSCEGIWYEWIFCRAKRNEWKNSELPIIQDRAGVRVSMMYFSLKTICHAEATGVCVRFNISMFSILPARRSAQNAKCVRSWTHTIITALPICRFRMTHHYMWKYTFLTPNTKIRLRMTSCWLPDIRRGSCWCVKRRILIY